MVSSTIVALLAATGAQLTLALPRGVQRAKILARQEDLAESYDYVIVGGGTAGLTVADRLTEDPDVTVLVIENGPASDSPFISTISGGFSALNGNFLYSINSVPQKNLQNRATAVLAGNVLGGSSAVNMMMTIRGTTGDYNRWGSFFGGNSSWSWEGMLPYFRKALTFVPPNDDVAKSANIIYDKSYWGAESGVKTSFPAFQYPGTAAQFESWKGMPGVEFPPDSGSGIPGVYWYPQFMDPVTATRSYAKTGHWENRKGRENYHVITEKRVNKILLDGKVATGVAFVSSGRTPGQAVQVKASKEVILSAGAVHSPQVMQLSGLGPKALLQAAGIETIVDLPGVGQNFQDHPMLTVRWNLRNFDYSPSPSDMRAGTDFYRWANQAFETNKTGPLTIATGNLAAWLSFPVISDRYEEMATMLEKQDHAAYLPAGTHETVAAGYKAQMLSFADALRSNHTAFYNLALSGSPGNGIQVDLHPLSRGTVNIDPKSPQAEPVVDYRALANPMDAKVMADIMRFSRKYYLNEANQKWGAAEVQPGARVTSDEDMADYLARTLSPTEYHPAGTCAMMPLEMGGVVDEELKVYGVGNLRIVDASVFPTLPGANTCQTTYALAEKAADIIKAAA